MSDEPSHPPSWETLQSIIHHWLIARFGINSARDKDVWLFCIASAMELERLAVAVLWIDDGRPKAFDEYEQKMTLGLAHREIEKRGLLDAVTRQILREVSELRDSVAHRQAIFVTAHPPIEGQAVGEYKGHHVFVYREALDQLIWDHGVAAAAMYRWMVAKAPDLAEQARRPESGADPRSRG